MTLDEVLLDEGLLPVFAHARIRQRCDTKDRFPAFSFEVKLSFFQV